MPNQRRKTRSFEFEVVTEKEAVDRRSRRGQRRSKYSAIGDKVRGLKNSEVLVFQASKNEVQGIRNYMRRNFDEDYNIYSRRGDGDMFEVHVAKSS